jgi:chromosome segregation ATPase
LQDEHYAKDGATARVTNELHYLKERYSELEEELRGQLDNNNRLSYEISALRSGGEDHESTLMERDSIISKLMGDVSSVKNKYRDL